MSSPSETEFVPLSLLKQFHSALTRLHQSKTMHQDLLQELLSIVSCNHAVLLTYVEKDAQLEYKAAFPKPSKIPSIFINTFNAAEESLIHRLKKQEIIHFEKPIEDERFASLTSVIQAEYGILLPVVIGENICELLVFYNEPSSPLPSDIAQKLELLCPSLLTLLQMIKRQENTEKRLVEVARESEILSRIDEELADSIDIFYVFTMMKDWALRFTNADAAALCLYDEISDSLRIMSHYGFKVGSVSNGQELTSEEAGISLRVARSGRAEIVPDVSIDPDYYELATGLRTQMSVPILREDRVIGVLSLLSKEISGFNDEHLDFAKRLSSRAGVAVDNARLFSETKREREKLSYIVQNIGDNIIVLGLDHHILMLNDAAIQSFHLSKDSSYIGKNLTDVISHQKLQEAYRLAVESQESSTTELTLPNGRTYHSKIEYHEGIGRIIVMQDITYYKEADKLKTELVSTVSHDLKQPLSVMRGYLDLLEMVNDFDVKSATYISNLNHAFYSMRQLIDDLLDIARIEAGVKLDLEPVNIQEVLNKAIRNNTPPAEQKNIKLNLDLPAELPSIMGDPARLEQIFNNLVSNAVKYTPPEGKVRVYTDVRQDTLRIFVEDNGLGISAEDQAQIFDRFFRVRRPETDSIEGTGLGLAIVKSLIEAHQGKIDLKSALGEGSTFRVSLPTT